MTNFYTSDIYLGMPKNMHSTRHVNWSIIIQSPKNINIELVFRNFLV